MGDNHRSWQVQLANTAIIGLSIWLAAKELGRGHERAASEVARGHERAACQLGDRLQAGMTGHMSAEGAGSHLLATGMASLGQALENSTPLATVFSVFPVKK